jgi:hypothetical protein
MAYGLPGDNFIIFLQAFDQTRHGVAARDFDLGLPSRRVMRVKLAALFKNGLARQRQTFPFVEDDLGAHRHPRLHQLREGLAL